MAGAFQTNFVKHLHSMTPADASSGRVVSFFYPFFGHDPYPVIIVTGFLSHNRIGGLNLRYLPFPTFRTLLNAWAGNPVFGYRTVVKHAPVLRQAFRTYKVHGIRNAKTIDWKGMLTVLSVMRTYSPQEMEAVKKAVDAQVFARRPEIIDEIFGSAAARAMAAQQVGDSTTL